MSSDETKQPAERQPLQFDTAEPIGGGGATATSLACTACSVDISTSYYEVNGAIVCISCRAKLRAQLTGGSGSARFAKAVGFGLLAAAAGSAVYYAILALTGYEIGLVAIAVGFLVGRGVNRGSQGRGGRSYQVLAVGLTYFAIVTTYIPFIVKAIRENPPAVAADSTARSTTTPDSASPTRVTAAAANAAPEQQGAPSAAPTAKSTELKVKNVTIGQALLGLAALLALAAAAPILAGFQNIIGMLIIGFALFEAWRQNQRLQLAITGPYRVGAKRDGQASTGAAGG
jgi:hypothetical protein